MQSHTSSGSEFEDAFASRGSFTQPPIVKKSSGLGATLADSATGLVRALSRGFSTGFEDEENIDTKISAAGITSDYLASPLLPSEVNAVATKGRHRTYTEQVHHVKEQGRSKHLNAVLKTSIGTTAYLIALLAGVALVPVPQQSKVGSCQGCCTDDAPCSVTSLPSGMRILGGNGTEVSIVMSSATSGYTVFTGEMQHDCPCSSTSSSEDDVSAVEGIDASSQAISTSQGTSSLSHLLDGSSQSYWCSLPHDLYKMAGANSPLFEALTVTFPQYITLKIQLPSFDPTPVPSPMPTSVPTPAPLPTRPWHQPNYTATATATSTTSETTTVGKEPALLSFSGNQYDYEEEEEDAFGGLPQELPDHRRDNGAASSSNASAVVRGVRLRVSTANQCGLKHVQIQAASDPSTYGKLRSTSQWINMTSIVTLCCSSEWQWVPLDDDARNLPMADVDGARAFLRVVLLSSFGNPYRITLNGIEVVALANHSMAPSLAPSITTFGPHR